MAISALGVQALGEGGLAGVWALDAGRSEIRFGTRILWGVVPVRGVFRQVRGDGIVTPAGEVSGTTTVLAGSVETGNRTRDSHLRSRLLDVDEYPEITFTIARVEPGERAVTVVGVLSVHGQAKPLSFGAQIVSPGDGEVWLDAEVEVDRADFGLDWSPLGLASTRNTIGVHAVFMRR